MPVDAESYLEVQAKRVLDCLPEEDRKIMQAHIGVRESKARDSQSHWNQTGQWNWAVGVGITLGIPLAVVAVLEFVDFTQGEEVRKQVKILEERCIEKIICDCPVEKP